MSDEVRKKASPDVQNSIVKIVNEIIALKKSNPNHDTSSLERQIDTVVYDIYGLTDADTDKYSVEVMNGDGHYDDNGKFVRYSQGDI